jgi:dephospho-CoA kinase
MIKTVATKDVNRDRRVQIQWNAPNGWMSFRHREANMIVAGLTGGIGTGKSTVATIFKRAGAIVIDADKIAKEAVQKGRPTWQKIVNHFGHKILLPNGEINRKHLADIIFNDPRQKNILNQIVHPVVFEETERMLKEIEKINPDAVVILDIPLLIESEMKRDLAEIIVVYIPEEIQIQRLMSRDGLSLPEALARIRAQIPIEEKKSKATILIDNSSSQSETRRMALRVFKQLQQKAGTTSHSSSDSNV